MMSEKLKTIKELADELGVSKNKIHYQVSKISSEYVVRNNSMKLLTAEAVKQIKENLGIELNSSLNSKLNTVKHQENTNIKGNTSVEGVELNSTLNSYLNSLKHQIEYLESQNINKDEQIKSLAEAQKQTQNLLDQQQRLALQDKKLLEEYKAENDRLKVLKMPSQETEFKHLDNQYKDEVNALKEKLENLQEQIKVQKRIEEQEKPRKWWGLWRK
jgi:coenzyme F420-reducing hydrogenase delta subunit